MTGERTVPILPCLDIDQTAEFYRVLGFERTYRQTKPNPYIVVKRDDIELHFATIDGLRPEDSYGSCIVAVPDTGELYQACADGMRTGYGKVLISGFPRMTRPRQRKNTGDTTGFSVIDPAGNWIRFFRAEPEKPRAQAGGKLAVALENAVVQGESRGDDRQAAKILDGALRRHTGDASIADQAEAMTYRAELAIRLGDHERAGELFTAIRKLDLAEVDQEVLDNLAELERAGKTLADNN